MSDTADGAPVTVVLGATAGIGSATARRLAARGDVVVLAARSEDRLKELADELDGAGAAGVTVVPTDATDSGQVEALFDRAVDEHGRVDGAVNCVGSLLLKPAHRTSDDEYHTQIRQNVDTAFFTVREAAKRMQRAGGGSIVLLTSAVSRLGLSNHEAIAAAKGAVISLMLAAASSYAHKGVRVNCVAPGMTETDMTAYLLENETSRKMSAKLHPMNTVGRPEEVASAIAWLLDREQRVVTGQTVGVDGGLGTLQPRHTAGG